MQLVDRSPRLANINISPARILTALSFSLVLSEYSILTANPPTDGQAIDWLLSDSNLRLVVGFHSRTSNSKQQQQLSLSVASTAASSSIANQEETIKGGCQSRTCTCVYEVVWWCAGSGSSYGGSGGGDGNHLTPSLFSVAGETKRERERESRTLKELNCADELVSAPLTPTPHCLQVNQVDHLQVDSR